MLRPDFIKLIEKEKTLRAHIARQNNDLFFDYFQTGQGYLSRGLNNVFKYKQKPRLVYTLDFWLTPVVNSDCRIDFKLLAICNNN